MGGWFRPLENLARILSGDPQYGPREPDALVNREFERLLKNLPDFERQKFRDHWCDQFNPDGDLLDDPHDRLVALWVALDLTVRDRLGAVIKRTLDDMCMDWLPVDVYVTKDDLVLLC